AQLALRDQRIVQAEEDLAWIVRSFSTQSAKDHRHAHRCSQAFPGDISDDGDERAVRCGGYKKEVATNLAGRQVDGLHLEAGRGTGSTLKKALLNCAGGVKLRGKGGTGPASIDPFRASARVGYRR